MLYVQPDDIDRDIVLFKSCIHPEQKNNSSMHLLQIFIRYPFHYKGQQSNRKVFKNYNNNTIISVLVGHLM